MKSISLLCLSKHWCIFALEICCCTDASWEFPSQLLIWFIQMIISRKFGTVEYAVRLERVLRNKWWGMKNEAEGAGNPLKSVFEGCGRCFLTESKTEASEQRANKKHMTTKKEKKKDAPVGRQPSESAHFHLDDRIINGFSVRLAGRASCMWDWGLTFNFYHNLLIIWMSKIWTSQWENPSRNECSSIWQQRPFFAFTEYFAR